MALGLKFNKNGNKMAVALSDIDIPIQWHFQGGMCPPAIPWRETAM
jgi:hypothetical protein